MAKKKLTEEETEIYKIGIYATINSAEAGDKVNDFVDNVIDKARENGDYVYFTLNSGIPPNPPPNPPK